MNGDGVGDFLTGAVSKSTYYDYCDYYWCGEVRVFHGPFSGLRSDEDADALILGDGRISSSVGNAVDFAGDTDGDGFGDIVASYFWDWIGSDLYTPSALFRGPLSGTYLAEDADARVGSDMGGYEAVGVGDVNGDGYSDIAKEDVQDSDNGYRLFALFEGPLEGDLSAASDAAATVRTRYDSGPHLAMIASRVGDVDGDGTDDVFAGMADYDTGLGEWTAEVSYLFNGPMSGALTLEDASACLYADPSGIPYVDRAGDLDGDGTPDLLVGAPHADTLAENAGAVYIVWGARF